VVTVNGDPSGKDTLNINDQGSKTKHTYALTATSLSRSGAAEIFFFNFPIPNVNKGPEIGQPPQAKDLTLTPAIGVGQLATLSGRLVDVNASAPLSLVVNWGDGSGPQTLQPGQATFSLTHTYQTAGTYKVHVLWIDTATDQFNSQDLTIQVKLHSQEANSWLGAAH
jgi:hypothetical protein